MDIIDYKMLINGKWVAASNGNNFTTINPSTMEVIATIPEATEDDVNEAVEAAHTAFATGPWSTMTPSQRGHCLRRLADLLVAESEKFGAIESVDTGKLYQETKWQAKYIAEFYYFYAGCADKIHGETLPIDKPNLFVYTNREPLGVVAAIIPWNSQMFLSAVKIGPALATGNTIVIKLSEHASAVMLEFGKLFAKAGIPKGVINLITGHASPCGKSLTSHPLVAKIAFTGGHTTAKHIIANSQHNFAQLSLELGGKSPFIVFDDANIESAVNGAVSGIFAASGQSCVAGSRLYLQQSIADDFLSRLKKIAMNVKIGDPMAEDTEMGPLCTQAQVENVLQEVKYAVEQGGKIIHGGKMVAGMQGLFIEPTIILCPRQDMRIVDTELFAPVLSVVLFKDESEVLKFANDSKYGLAAGIFTQNNARAIRMANTIHAGIVWVNTYRAVSPIATFGGMKNSGYGRESGFNAVYEYTRQKTVWINTADEPLASQFVAR